MAEYAGTQSVLNAALGHYHNEGFSLVQPDDHIVTLYHQDEKVADFSWQGMTILALHETCRQHLEKIGAKV